VAVFFWHTTAVAVAVAGPICTMHCVSIICPIPFPLRLITTHTSTAAAVVNNMMFYDATWLSLRLCIVSYRIVFPYSCIVPTLQTTYSQAVRPVNWDRRGQPGWADDMDARDRRRPLRSRCDERSPRHIAGPPCWPNRANGEADVRGGGERAVSPTRRAFMFHMGSNKAAFRWLSLHAALQNTERQF